MVFPIISLFHVSIISLKLQEYHSYPLTHKRKKITRKSILECELDCDVHQRSNTGTLSWKSECNAVRSGFNADISKWNTASVTTLRSTFSGATSFTGDGVSNWNTSKVTSLFFTFYEVFGSFDADLSNWDTSRVTSLS